MLLQEPGARVSTNAGTGTVRFSGNTDFAAGVWIGVELDTQAGKNDGSVAGRYYFECAPGYGLFVRPAQLKEAPVKRPVPSSTPSSRQSSASLRPSISSRPTSNASSLASTPLATKTLPAKPVAPKSAPRRSGVLHTPKPSTSSANGNRAPARRPSSLKTLQPEDLGTQRTPSISHKPTIVEPSQPSESSRSRSPSPAQIADDDSPLLSAIPLPLETSQEPTTTDTKPKTRPSQMLPPSTPTTGPLNYTNQHDQNYPISPSPVTRTLEQTVPKRDYEECQVRLKLSEQHREKELSKLRELESQLDQVKQFNIMKPKLQSKIVDMQNEIKDLRSNNRDLLSQNDNLEQQQKEASDLLELATLDKELAEEKAEGAITELENLQEQVLDLNIALEDLKSRVEDGQNEEATMSKAYDQEDSALGNKQLVKQNERLKMALIRLRDVTNENESMQRNKVVELQREVKDLKEMQEKCSDMQTLLQESEAHVGQLKHQLDDSLASAELVEHLTDKNLSLTEQVESMRATIEDLEALKELSDELEESHHDTEKQLQELLDYKDLHLIASMKRISELLETTADYQSTILQFREHMQLLQGDIDDMRQTQLQQATESEALTSQSQAMLSLNQKLQTTAHKSQAKAIDLELKKLDAAQASEHLRIVQNYLPITFFESGDADSANCLLFFQRCAFKSDLINQVVAQAHGIPNSLYDSVPEILVGVCELRSKLTHFAAINRRFAAMVRRCPADMYLRMGKVANEIKGTERKIDHWLELLRKEEFREFECTKDIIMLLAQFEHLVELYLENSQLDLDELELDSVLAIDCDLDSTTAAIGLSKQMIIGIDNDAGIDKELGAFEVDRDFFEPVQRVIASIKMSKSISRKFAARIRSCIRDSSAIEPTVSNKLSILSNQTAKLNNFAVSFAQSINNYIGMARESADAFEYTKIIEFVNEASQALRLNQSYTSDGWSKVNEFVDAFAETINDVLQTSLEPDSVVKLISEEPWLVRMEEFKAVTTQNIQAEQTVFRLTNDVKELVRGIRSKDQTLQEAGVKIEVMSKKLDTVKKQTEILESRENEVSRLKRVEKTLGDALDVLQVDLNNVEQENDRLKRSMANTDQSAGPNISAAGLSLEGLGGHEGSLEKSVLVERIDSLMSVMRYLRSENAHLRSKDERKALQGLKAILPLRSPTPPLDSDNESNDSTSMSDEPPTPALRQRSVAHQLVGHLARTKIVDLSTSTSDIGWPRSAEMSVLRRQNETQRLVKAAKKLSTPSL